MFAKLKQKILGTPRKKRAFKYIGLPILAFVALFLIVFAGYSIAYAHKFYANQYLGGENISGKTANQTKELLSPKISSFLDSSIFLGYEKDGKEEKTFEIKPKDIGLQYDLDKSIGDTIKYGHGNGPFVDLWQQIKSLFVKNKVSLSYSLDQEVLNQKIGSIASELDIPEKDYSITYESGRFKLIGERTTGQRINQDEIKGQINQQIGVLSSSKIAFESKVFEPQVDKTKAEARLAQANQILDAGPLYLTYSGQKYTVDKDIIGAIITSATDKDDLKIIFNEDKLKTYIASVAGRIDTNPQNATLKIADGKATVFKSAVIGKKVDQSQVKIDIENALFSRIGGSRSPVDSIAIKVDETKPDVSDDAINNLGIVDLVGTGTTDFKGSPANRVHNIQVGATAINGTILKPGETFSTLKKLAPIDASAGYLPELVIKDNKTVPDYGGGLCQVSTTLFRAAMNAGLYINERQNHSYRVSYYEPPVGMDASIFDPSPDFRFTNNYSSYLLVQATISGTKITFDIYGTKDSRNVKITDPVLSDIIDPPVPLYIETTSLAPGEQKITDHAHQGATATFHYTVMKDGKALQDRSFVSKYVPWQEKILIGVSDPSATPTTPATPLTPDTPAPQSSADQQPAQ